jgi:hypothetical protein
MAGIDETRNSMVKSMWVEAGIQFRSNLASNPGCEIRLHSHSYDHVSFITYGLFAVKEITPAGEIKTYLMASKGYPAEQETVGCRVLIPKFHQHSFTLLEATDQPGEVLCMWSE